MCSYNINKANLGDLIALTGLVILLKSDSSRQFFSLCDHIIWLMTSKNNSHLFFTTSSFMRHFKAIGELKLVLQSGNAQFGSKLAHFFVPRDLDIWWMTLKINRASFLYHVNLCASFQNYGWIRTGVTVRKRQLWVKIGNFCLLWPWNSTDHPEKQ